MTCKVCGKEHEGGVTITLLGQTSYICSALCAFKSGHSDQVKEKMIAYFSKLAAVEKNKEERNEQNA